MIDEQPLVSILIPNYNHSRYLDECITSAINQTYSNLEIIVLDNASEDNSVEVAKKYMKDSRVRVCRNGKNILNTSYTILDRLSNGKYKMLLCADDYIESTFVEKAVKIMEAYPNIGYVHVERDFITDKGQKLDLDFFFNCSFIAPGREVMPIYTVTTIAHPSQGIFRTETFRKIGGYEMEIDHMNADRMLWFYMSYEADYAYIREKLCNIRIGEQTETFITQKNFQHPILCHLTLKEMMRFAKKYKLSAVYAREAEAGRRLARDFLNYAAGMMVAQDMESAGRYLDYAVIVSGEIIDEECYRRMIQMLNGTEPIDIIYLKLMTKNALQKKRGYDPPQNYRKINLEDFSNE